MDIRACEASHCSIADPEIYAICRQNGLPAGYPVLTKDTNGVCTCSCSCLAFGTPVAINAEEWAAVETIKVGDTVLAAGRDLAWKEVGVQYSQGTESLSRQPNVVLITYADTAIAVTGDHLFLMEGGVLKPADRLVVGDRLTARDGAPVPIHSVHVGDYTAGFHHIATRKALPDADLSDHLLITNGVVSADYIVQIAARSGEDLPALAKDLANLPTIGSVQYVKAHGDDCYAPPQDARIAKVAAFNAPSGERQAAPTFISASQTKLVIPADAHGFLPDAEAEEKTLEAMRAFGDVHSREWTEYLFQHHRAFYPQVVFQLDWSNNTVNAYAWVQNGVRYVAILGGLVRHLALEIEGIAVVLAHELAHHFGGAPSHDGGLSCEGQSDYHGVRTIMRRVWFGDQYITMTDRGIAQMAQFWQVPNSPAAPGGSAGCSHPANACRIATFHSAVRLAGRPACAG